MILTERFYPEEFKINGLARFWEEQGFKVGVLTQVPSYPAGKIFPGHRNFPFQIDKWGKIFIYRIFTILRYERSLIFKLFNYFSFMINTCLVALFIGRRYDHVFVFQTGPLTQALAGILIKKLFRKRLSIWTQDVWPDTVWAYGFKKNFIFKSMLEKFVRLVYRNCDTILVSSRAFIGRIKPFAHKRPIQYFPNWPDDNLKSTVTKKVRLSRDRKIHFTFAGNIGKVQNLENIILAFGALPERWRVQLNIIGDGSHLKYLRSLVAKRDLSRIVFWGRKPSKEMMSYYRPSDVLVISLTSKPIFQITIPSKFQTYLFVKKPIFCVMEGVVADMVRQYQLGLVSHPDSVKDIITGFKQFYMMKPERRKQYGRKAKEILEKYFNKDKIIKGITSGIGISSQGG